MSIYVSCKKYEMKIKVVFIRMSDWTQVSHAKRAELIAQKVEKENYCLINCESKMPIQ